MSALRLVMGDQLSRDLASLADLAPDDVILMAELSGEARVHGHHRQKIALIFAAMRHFAQGLREEGWRVDYIHLDAPQENPGNFSAALDQALAAGRFDRVILTCPSEIRVEEEMRRFAARAPIPVEIREDDRFFCSRADFAAWARGRKNLRMEFFYRDMRRKTGLLMRGDQPLGGRWNFDAENRKAFPHGRAAPPRKRFAPDAVTREVLALVAREFPQNFGALDGFGWPVTRAEALEALDDFLRHHLAIFGDFQDAMKADAPFLHHALIAPALNLGLLNPREIVQGAVAALEQGAAPLAAVEGFVRQILGWREFVRGFYALHGRDRQDSNFFDAQNPLPAFFWSGDTAMHCLAQVVTQTRREAYAHHIQRLMAVGNFALLAGLAPAEVEDWFLCVYADAFEWVEWPNVHAMALFAEGGLLASKPYAASGAYLSKMSDYCECCAFDPKRKTGPDACPFNPLYWAFFERHRPKLAKNPRLALVYRQLDRLAPDRRAGLADEAEAALAAACKPAAFQSAKFTPAEQTSFGF